MEDWKRGQPDSRAQVLSSAHDCPPLNSFFRQRAGSICGKELDVLQWGPESPQSPSEHPRGCDSPFGDCVVSHSAKLSAVMQAWALGASMSAVLWKHCGSHGRSGSLEQARWTLVSLVWSRDYKTMVWAQEGAVVVGGPSLASDRRSGTFQRCCSIRESKAEWARWARNLALCNYVGVHLSLPSQLPGGSRGLVCACICVHCWDEHSGSWLLYFTVLVNSSSIAQFHHTPALRSFLPPLPLSHPELRVDNCTFITLYSFAYVSVSPLESDHREGQGPSHWHVLWPCPAQSRASLTFYMDAFSSLLLMFKESI